LKMLTLIEDEKCSTRLTPFRSSSTK